MKLSCRPHAVTSYEVFFKKTKRGLEPVSLSCFLYDLWWKVCHLLYSINWPNFFVWLFLLLEILGNMCIAIVYLESCDVIYFEINLIFLIKPFFLTDQKVKTKIQISWEWNELLTWAKKHLSFLKGFYLSKQNKLFCKGRVRL